MATHPDDQRLELLQGTLDMLVLRTLQWGPRHGHGIGQAIRMQSDDVLKVETGSLYPALHRLVKRGWLKAEWGDLSCEVLEVEHERTLAYSWTGLGLDSVVTWTLTPVDGGTRLTMVQTGFLPEQKLAYHGARAGWPRFLDRLEAVLAALD